jgi:hypothetical protein
VLEQRVDALFGVSPQLERNPNRFLQLLQAVPAEDPLGVGTPEQLTIPICTEFVGFRQFISYLVRSQNTSTFL